MQVYGDTVAAYRDFAGHVAGESPCFEEWALAVAGDADVLDWLAGLPEIKRQPNLVFAAGRWHGVPAPGPYAGLRDALLGDDGPLRQTILDRATQTNEVGRLATLTPVLAAIDGPVALIEVGASAGLCLYPDRYDYSWPPAGTLGGSGGPVLTADARGGVPIPATHPQIAWRGGLDLNPLDVRDDDAMAWLTTLVWPEDGVRRDRLLAAIEVARADPPTLIRGDLLTETPGLVLEAARHGTVVVMHSAVIAYLEEPDRETFVAIMRDLIAGGGVHWLSNEGPDVLPGLAVPGPRPANRFLLALDARPLAWTHGHGRTITWL